MDFSSLRVIEFSCKIWILFSTGNFVSHFKGQFGPADLVKVPEIGVSYVIVGMILLLFPLSEIFHLVLNG